MPRGLDSATQGNVIAWRDRHPRHLPAGLQRQLAGLAEGLVAPRTHSKIENVSLLVGWFPIHKPLELRIGLSDSVDVFARDARIILLVTLTVIVRGHQTYGREGILGLLRPETLNKDGHLSPDPADGIENSNRERRLGLQGGEFLAARPPRLAQPGKLLLGRGCLFLQRSHFVLDFAQRTREVCRGFLQLIYLAAGHFFAVLWRDGRFQARPLTAGRFQVFTKLPTFRQPAFMRFLSRANRGVGLRQTHPGRLFLLLSLLNLLWIFVEVLLDLA